MSAKTKFELYCEDCIQGMRRLDNDSIDVVVTSPPYNLGIKYRNYHDSRKSDEYLTWCKDWAKEVQRVLKPNGSFFLNLGSCPSNPLVPHELVVELKRSLFVLQNTFHWIKSITIETREKKVISAGHFKPLNSRRFVNDCHEYVFHLTRTGSTPLDRMAVGVPYSDKSNIKRWAHTGGADVRCRGNNWFIPYKTIVNRSKDRPHPATFPVDLAVTCIKIHGLRGDLVVMDPFLGIGHSALAAQRCRVARFVGYDIDNEYLQVARESLSSGKTTATERMKAEGSSFKRKRRRGEVDGFLFEAE